MKLPEGKTRLDLVREGLANIGLKKRGRLIVGIERLKEDLRNERRTFRNMEGLIASIKAVGLVEPITVTPEAGDTYRIVTGHRRFRAAKSAGLAGSGSGVGPTLLGSALGSSSGAEHHGGL